MHFLGSLTLWLLAAAALCVIGVGVLSIAAGRSKIRKQWMLVLDRETELWSVKPCAQLIGELADVVAYEIEFESMLYQVEVELLEDTAEYVNVMVSVDDGSLPASLRPVSTNFLCHKS
jgi:hypothetical protein